MKQLLKEIGTLDNFFDFACCYYSIKVARSDGNFSDKEMKAIKTMFDFSNDDANLLKKALNDTRFQEIVTKLVTRTYKNDEQSKEELINNLFISEADGEHIG